MAPTTGISDLWRHSLQRAKAEPTIPAARIREFYAGIFRSPLVSGYAASKWAEDFADSVAFYHLTQKLHQPYSVRIVEDGRPVSVHKPLESPVVQQRWSIIAGLYQQEATRSSRTGLQLKNVSLTGPVVP